MQKREIVKVLCLKERSGNPADGIDNFNQAVFILFSGRVRVTYRESRGWIGKMAYMLFRQPDCLVGYGHAREILFLMCKPRGMRYVINFHTILLRSGADGWRVRTPWFLRSFVFSRAWAVVCVSEYIASTVRAQFPRAKIAVILNGVDTDLFDSKKSEAKKANQAVFVGTLEPRKRPHLVFAMALALPHMHFVFVGRDRAPWHFTRMMGGIPNAEWRPSLPRAEVARLFAESSVFVFPSVNEPAAAVILEAMASGCVPVVSASGGNAEFFADGVSGFAVPHNGNEQEVFLEKIRLLMDDGALRARMAQAARAEAERHSWNAVAREYEKFFMV